MLFLRRKPKLAPTARVTIRLTTDQRDQLLHSPALPRALGHLLHRAPVKKGKLEIRVNRSELDTLIETGAKQPVARRADEKALDVFLLYLENQADRFDEPRSPGDSPEHDEAR